MAPDQTIELANQAGITFITKTGVASATEEWLVEFARLVGNAKLEEAAMKVISVMPYHPDLGEMCAKQIRSLKK